MLCLAGMLNSTRLPTGIQLRLEGELPSFNEFYLEQLADLARLRGVLFQLHVARSTGVRDSRDWHIANCPTDYVWMLDDDVIPHAECLTEYLSVLERLVEDDFKKFGFLAGSKCDVNNRRNYPFFDTTVHGRTSVNEKSNHSLIYDYEECSGLCAPTRVLDTGNCFLFLKPIRAAGVTFRQFADQFNPSGDATTFSLALDKAGLSGHFIPAAIAYHLEKPGGGFNEFEARGEMLLRTCEVKEFDKQIVKDYWMPKG